VRVRDGINVPHYSQVAARCLLASLQATQMQSVQCFGNLTAQVHNDTQQLAPGAYSVLLTHSHTHGPSQPTSRWQQGAEVMLHAATGMYVDGTCWHAAVCSDSSCTQEKSDWQEQRPREKMACNGTSHFLGTSAG
jgi:hypothetical protein